MQVWLTCWKPFFPSDGSMVNLNLVSTPTNKQRHWVKVILNSIWVIIFQIKYTYTTIYYTVTII